MDYDNNNIINGFWYGIMTPLQIISIKSFIKNGHKYKLWIYPNYNIEYIDGNNNDKMCLRRTRKSCPKVCQTHSDQ